MTFVLETTKKKVVACNDCSEQYCSPSPNYHLVAFSSSSLSSFFPLSNFDDALV